MGSGGIWAVCSQAVVPTPRLLEGHILRLAPEALALAAQADLSTMTGAAISNLAVVPVAEFWREQDSETQ